MKKTLFVSGKKRSGNHAIISWLIGQFDKPVLFLNAVNPKGQDPLENFMPIELPPNSYCHIERINGKKIRNYSKEEIAQKNHDYLLCSTENRSFEQFLKLEQFITSKFGKSEKIINIIILRDPVNALASYIRWKKLFKIDFNEARQISQRYLKQWLNHAKTIIYKNDEMQIVPIIYNKWILDQDYRDEICDSLGLINRDKNIDYISDAGQGSSFEQRNIDISRKQDFLKRFERLDASEKKLLVSTLNSEDSIRNISQTIFGNEYDIPTISSYEKDIFGILGKNKNKKNEPADILRDVAISFETIGDYHTAAKIMKQALLQRPSGPTIKRKFNFYQEKIKTQPQK